ncbi:hypothetical protein RYX36_004672 [Vicia faba]
MIVIWPFDVNKPEVDEIKGGVAGGRILRVYFWVNIAALCLICTCVTSSVSHTYNDLVLMLIDVINKLMFHAFYLQIEVQYLHDHAGFTTTVHLNHNPTIDFSATIGTPVIVLGA